MDLRRKLQQLESEGRLFQKKPESSAHEDVGSLVEGTEVRNASGRFFKTEQNHPNDTLHGSVPLRLLFDIPPTIFSWVGKNPVLSGFDFSRAVFLDTETTGLAGGTGTVPFLIGLGYFTENGFCIEQYFMRDFDEEAAVLLAVRESLSRFQFLVSYNGKAYDLALLSTRFILARMSNPADGVPHLDLLHTARRLWKRRIGDCSLSSIERSVLGFIRENDVPGFYIPQLYFDYLRTRNAGPLVPVFRHNRWDILALVSIAALAGRIYQCPFEHLDHAIDFLSLGKTMESMFRMEEAAACYRSAFDRSMETEERDEALFRLGLAWKRLGNWDKAVSVWEYCIQNLPFSVAPYEELAKYYEHRIQDFGKALQWTQRALDRITILGGLNPDASMETGRQNFEIRLDRLKRKIQIRLRKDQTHDFYP